MTNQKHEMKFTEMFPNPLNRNIPNAVWDCQRECGYLLLTCSQEDHPLIPEDQQLCPAMENGLNQQMENANSHCLRKASEVATDPDATELLTQMFHPETTLEIEDPGSPGLALAKLTGAGLCEITEDTIRITQAGQILFQSLQQNALIRRQALMNEVLSPGYGPNKLRMIKLANKLHTAFLEGPSQEWPPRVANASPSKSIGSIQEITEDGGSFELNELGHQLVIKPRSALTMERIDYCKIGTLTTIIWARVISVGPRYVTFRIEDDDGIHDDYWPKHVTPLLTRMPVHLAPTHFHEIDRSEFERTPETPDTP